MRRRWNRYFAMVAALLPLIASMPRAASADDPVRSIKVGGLERTYRLHVPPGGAPAPMALVMVLHGGGGNGSLTDRQTHFSAEADRQHFIVAYPDGTGRTGPFLAATRKGGFFTWNAGDCCAYAMEHRVDDVAFLRAMVAAIARELPVDPRRVYAAGISNGGMMAYRLACEASDLVAAVGVVSGAVVVKPCAPKSPVAGDPDPRQRRPERAARRRRRRQGAHRHELPAGAELDRSWTAADGCTAPPVTSEPAAGVTLRDYRACRAGTEVAYYLITGGGHAWPGGTRMAAFLDTPSTALAATPTIWEFFAAHPKR